MGLDGCIWAETNERQIFIGGRKGKAGEMVELIKNSDGKMSLTLCKTMINRRNSHCLHVLSDKLLLVSGGHLITTSEEGI